LRKRVSAKYEENGGEFLVSDQPKFSLSFWNKQGGKGEDKETKADVSTEGVGVGKRIFGEAIRALYKKPQTRGEQMKWEWFCLPNPEAKYILRPNEIGEPNNKLNNP